MGVVIFLEYYTAIICLFWTEVAYVGIWEMNYIAHAGTLFTNVAFHSDEYTHANINVGIYMYDNSFWISAANEIVTKYQTYQILQMD